MAEQGMAVSRANYRVDMKRDSGINPFELSSLDTSFPCRACENLG